MQRPIVTARSTPPKRTVTYRSILGCVYEIAIPFLAWPQCITLNHKEYEVMIQRVQRSFTNSLRMRLRKKLQPLEQEGPAAAATAAGTKKAAGAKAAAAGVVAAGGDRTRTRLPRFYKEAGLVDGSGAGDAGGSKGQEQGQVMVLREHYPPASW